MHLLDLVIRVQVMHWFSFGKDAFEMNPHHPILGEQNHLSPNWQHTKKDGALPSKAKWCCFVFVFLRGRGVSSRFVIFGCCSCLKKVFISSALVQLPHEVYFTYLPMCGTPCYGKKPIRLTLLSGNLGFPSQESFLPFFMVEWGNYSIFFSKTRILETSHFLLRHDHRKI